MVDRVEEVRARHAANRAPSGSALQSQSPPPQRSVLDPLEESLPTGAEAINILGAVRDGRVSSRRLFVNDSENPPSSSDQLPLVDSLLADRFCERLVASFNEVADGLDALDRSKAAISEWERQFGTASYQEKEQHARMLSLQDARDLLCIEMQRAEQSDKKIELLTKRCRDLEKKLCDSETYSRKVFDVYYQKTHDEVKVLLTEVRAKEMELLSRVEKADRERRSLTEVADNLKQKLRESEKREENLQRELTKTTSAYHTVSGQRQEAASQAEAARIEINRLEQNLRSVQEQLTEMTTRERESRTESARHADSARSARASEEKRVIEATREANRKLAECEKHANDEVERMRREMASEYQQMQIRMRDLNEALRVEREKTERYADRARHSEAKVSEWQQKYDMKVEEMKGEMQVKLAANYRDLMMDMGPERRINREDDENRGLNLFAREPPTSRSRPSRPSSRGPPMAPIDPPDNRKRNLRDAISTHIPTVRR